MQCGMPAYPRELAKGTILHPLLGVLLPEMDEAMEDHYRALADRRTAAAALAARAFAVNHAGKYPESLGELVPGYLTAVPADPTSSGRAIAYRNSDRPGDPSIFCDSGLDAAGEPQSIVHLTPVPSRAQTMPATLPSSRP